MVQVCHEADMGLQQLFGRPVCERVRACSGPVEAIDTPIVISAIAAGAARAAAMAAVMQSLKFTFFLLVGGGYPMQDPVSVRQEQ